MSETLTAADVTSWGVVYFIRAGVDGRIKIGWSRNVELRLKHLQTASPVPLHVMAIEKGSRMVECRLHREFCHLRRGGEWFEPGRELLEYTANLGGRP